MSAKEYTGANDGLAKIATYKDGFRAEAEKLHAAIMNAGVTLYPRLWYGACQAMLKHKPVPCSSISAKTYTYNLAKRNLPIWSLTTRPTRPKWHGTSPRLTTRQSQISKLSYGALFKIKRLDHCWLRYWQCGRRI